ncbi:MAG: hypothetical protein JSV23_07305 [Promethearchaeota archaeon]|nr:MAG: hypothetical protein JSV23_07305 [Candidatus Lokiarchaeota archaeon]
MLERAGRVINSIIKGLEEIPLETRKKIMGKSGETCALAGSFKIAKKIAEETTEIEQIIAKINNQVPWCGKWKLDGNKISSTCLECGCPLIRNKIVVPNGTFCYCSVGWTKKIFETLLKRPVDVELKKSKGAGDDICKFNIFFKNIEV